MLASDYNQYFTLDDLFREAISWEEIRVDKDSHPNTGDITRIKLIADNSAGAENVPAFIIEQYPSWLHREILSDENAKVFPLFKNEVSEKTFTPVALPNLRLNVIKQINMSLKLTYIPQEENGNVCFATNNSEIRDEFKQVYTSIDLLDYIYSILYAPHLKEAGGQPIKIPLPKNEDIFWTLVKLGSDLRNLHLGLYTLSTGNIGTNTLKSSNTETLGSFVNPCYERSNHQNKSGKLYINPDHWFEDISEYSWEFSILGLSPIQSWLAIHEGECLTEKNIIAFSNLVYSITKTEKLVQEIGRVL